MSKMTKLVLRIVYGLGIAYTAASFQIENPTLHVVMAFVGGIMVAIGASGWEEYN